MLKHRVGKLVIALVVVLVVASILIPPMLASADYSYHFEPNSTYSQSDGKVVLRIYPGSGDLPPVGVDWVDPQGNHLTCSGGQGTCWDQSVGGNGVLIWRVFYLFIAGYQRLSGTYTARVYSIQGTLFSANFSINGSVTLPPPPPSPTFTPTMTLSPTPPGTLRRCYVSASASGANTGASWIDAYTDLQSALGASTCTEVWVQSGTYRPTAGTDRSATFRLKNYVALYGGFAGTESARADRNPAFNVTILSGDIGAPGDNSDNSYHVVSGASSASLDGFTITAGNADASADPNNYGGGMYNSGSNPALANITFSNNSATFGGGMYNSSSSPTLTNITFSGNSAPNDDVYRVGGRGGGMYNESSNPSLTHVTFSNNSAGSDGSRMYDENGGGMYNENSSPTLTNVTFSDNSAPDEGGGMFNWSSSPTLTNVTFNDNSAFNDGGGDYVDKGNGGGMYNAGSNPTLTNVTFNDNSAFYDGGGYYEGEGGGMFNGGSNPTLTNVTFSGNSSGWDGGGMENDSFSSPTLTNVTLSGNTAYSSGGGMENDNMSFPDIRNTILWGNIASIGAQIYNDDDSGSTVSYSVVQGGYADGAHIITADPLLGTLGDHGGFTQTIPLLAGSSAIDTGDNSVCPATDQRGYGRPVDGDGNGSAICDIGAYEFGAVPVNTPTPTPTDTYTPTTTQTSTLTPTATLTVTPTPTRTMTPTTTQTSTLTPTTTQTPISTPTETMTPTPTLTPTITEIPTGSYKLYLPILVR